MKTLKKCGLFLGIALFMCSFCGFSVMSAMAEDETVTVKTDFTTLASFEGVSAIVESAGVSVNADASHGAIPSDEWGSPFLIADKSYIIYEIDAKVNGEDRIFDTVGININGRVWNQNDGTAHAENAVNVYTGIKKNNVSNLVYSYTPANSNNSTNFAALGGTLDLSTFFSAGYNKVYVKVELVQSKASNGGTTAEEDGTIDIWFAGVKLSSVEITATTKVGESAIVPDFEMVSDFTTQSLSAANVKTAVGVCSDSNEHGLVAGNEWGASVTVPAESYVIYELKADERKVFDKLILGISGKLWGQNDEAAYAYNSFIISFSNDNVVYNNPITLTCEGVGNGDFVYNGYDASENIPAKSDTIYIKIELKQYVADAMEPIELAFLGTKLYKVSADGVFADKEYAKINYYDGTTLINTVEYEKGSEIAEYIPEAKEGYDFDGWYLDAALTQKVDDNYVINDDISVYGKWTAKVLPENPDNPEETKKGCGSHIEAAPIAIVLAAFALAVIVIRRKKNRG